MNHILNFETDIRNQIWKWNFIWCPWLYEAKISMKVYTFTLRKSVGIRSYSGPHFPAFVLNTERSKVSLDIQAKLGKLRARITSNMDIFQSVLISWSLVVSNSIHKYTNSIESCCKYIGNHLFTIRLGDFGLLMRLEPTILNLQIP